MVDNSPLDTQSLVAAISIIKAHALTPESRRVLQQVREVASAKLLTPELPDTKLDLALRRETA